MLYMGTYGHITCICFRSNFTNKWDAGFLCEFLYSFPIELLLKCVLGFIKVLVEDNRRLFNPFSLGKGGVVCSAKQIVVSE